MDSHDELNPSFSTRRGHSIRLPHDHNHPVAAPKTGLLSVRPPTPYPRCRPPPPPCWWPEAGAKEKMNRRPKAGSEGPKRRGRRGRKTCRRRRPAAHADTHGSGGPCSAEYDGDKMMIDSQPMSLDLETSLPGPQDGGGAALAVGISNMSVDD